MVTAIQFLKKGDYFKKEGKKTVYVFGGYNRFTKKYTAHKFEDFNSASEMKKDTRVEIGFTF